MASKKEPTDVNIDEAGKGNLDDEMLPNEGEPMKQRDTDGNQYDTAGEHGDMHPETAKSLNDKAKEK